jgi:hypothetical protein
MDALPAPGEMMQQKVGRRDATPDLLLKHLKYNSCNIRLKAVETLRNMILKHLKKTP